MGESCRGADFGWRVRTALSDSWQAEGAIRAGAAEIRGARLMASGLLHPQWNGAAVTSDDVDLDAVRRWYGERGVPWGIRVEPGVAVELDEHVMTQPCMGVTPERWRHPSGSLSVAVEPVDLGRPEQVRTFLDTSAAAFGDPPEVLDSWTMPGIGQSGWCHYLARLDGAPAGVGYTTVTDDRAGPAAGLWGVGTTTAQRRRGVATALVARAVEDAFGVGSELVVLNPAGESPPLYEALGFVSVAGVEVWNDRGGVDAGMMQP